MFEAKYRVPFEILQIAFRLRPCPPDLKMVIVGSDTLEEKWEKNRNKEKIREECLEMGREAEFLDRYKPKRDPRCFFLPIEIGGLQCNTMVDLGTCESLLPLSIYEKINVGELKPNMSKLSMANGTPLEIEGEVKIHAVIGNSTTPIDFSVTKMKKEDVVPIILGRPFLANVDTIIDVKNRLMLSDFENGKVSFSYDKEKDAYVMRCKDAKLEYTPHGLPTPAMEKKDEKGKGAARAP